MEKEPLLVRILALRSKYVKDRQLILFLSVVIGLAAGLAATVIKKLVRLIQELVKNNFLREGHNYLYIILPFVGLFIVVLFIKYINKRPVRHGIPSVLYSISKNKGVLRRHNLYSSIITSALTVGFGGSVGLEGPAIATGAAIGSNVGGVLKLEYKQVVLLLGCASTGAMAAIFKAPIAAIIFALEVIMLDLTMASLTPLLLASVSAYLVSLKLMGDNVLYSNFEITEKFVLGDYPYYILLGVLAGFMSLYFTRTYIYITELFEKMKGDFTRLIIGGIAIGVLIFFIPSLYGEGYDITNQSLDGKCDLIFSDTFFESFMSNQYLLLIVLLVTILLKAVATSLTFGAGGVGGVFAPTLFMGATLGLFFVKSLNIFGMDLPLNNFALVGMGGMIAGVIHAPLTAIFLIAEMSSGYDLFVPLMIVATISYATIRLFEKNSVYTIQLANKGELMTHDKDKAMLMLMNLKKLIEADFIPVHPDQNLGDLVAAVSKSKRNVFPVLNEDEDLVGILTLNDIRHIMFKTELYKKTFVSDIMYFPSTFVEYTDSLEQIVEKIETSGRYNVPVLDKGKYVGFVSRAKIFSTYRKMLKNFSDD